MYKRQHEGSIGNLCNDEISALMQEVVDGFNFHGMEVAEKMCIRDRNADRENAFGRLPPNHGS